ncbi:MAG: YggT family protein [Candidatus Margulisbacteria bacterium]|nr:YggT family protein [Candidatus Margulisiibacteriota bacterium]
MLFNLLAVTFQAIYILLIARTLLSWIPHNPNHAIIQWIYKLTEPVLGKLREMIPPLGGTLDISPIIAYILIGLIQKLVWQLLF